jgi:error-prone DNA polymerase
MPLSQHVIEDYRALQLTLKQHPMAFLRQRLNQRGIVANDRLAACRNGQKITVAGLVLVRQRPGTASGVVFVTIEDEHGIANLVVWPKVFEGYRRVVMGSRLLGVQGRVQREELVIHLVAERLWDWSAELDSISDIDTFHLDHGRGDQVRTDSPDRRVHPPVPVPEANATRHRVSKNQPAKSTGYDRSRIALDRPKIKIASRDFH